MTDYRAILLFFSKNNTVTQIATICGCSRPTVYKTIQRAKAINLQVPVPNTISDEELYVMLNPKKGRRAGYYYPDFNELDHDRIKRNFTKYRAWQKYCRVAQRMGLKAYKKSRFYKLFHNFFSPLMSALKAKTSKILEQIRAFDIAGKLILSRFGENSLEFENIKAEIVAWCKKLRLEPRKIYLT